MCNNLAGYRFTWPGKDESFICEEHVHKLRATANAIGMYLQVIPLSKEELEAKLTCNQK